jgi:hypothetical protein
MLCVTVASASVEKANLFMSNINGKLMLGAGYAVSSALVKDNFSGDLSSLDGSMSYLLNSKVLVDIVQERLQDGNPDLTRLTVSYVYNRVDLEQKFYIGGGLMQKWFDFTDTKLGAAVVGGILWPSDINTAFKLGGKYGYFGGNDPLQANVFGLEIGVVQKF